MNPVTITLGVVAIVYGLFTLLARIKKPELFGKLNAMQERWGPQAGMAMHVVGYTVLPILFGGVLILRGLQGGSLVERGPVTNPEPERPVASEP